MDKWILYLQWMPSNFHYNKSLQSKANELRKNMTKAEACLWKYVLSRRKLNGKQFRRQRPIDRYVVDFVCLPLKLIVEVDGISHTYDEVVESDETRQLRLEELGFRVIRFTDEEVLTVINRVRENILAVINEIEVSTP